MTTQEIAEKLISYCREGKWEEAQKELYADDVVSIEAEASPVYDKITKGLPAIIEKGNTFNSMVDEFHSLVVSEPLVAGAAFSMTMTMDVKLKGQDREVMSELCVYEVKDGKVISEQFYP